MKKIILSLLIVITSGSVALCQNNGGGFHLGAKLGANFGKIDGQKFKDGFELGYQLGGFAEIDFNKSIGIQPEVLFSQTNTKTTSDAGEVFHPGDNIHLNYLNIPILLRINAGKILTFNLGPQYSILMNNHETLVQNGADAFKTGDFSMVAGAQVNIGSLRVYGRYNIGLTDISDISNQDKWKTQTAQLGIGFRIL